MSDTSVIAILASVGIVLAGTVSADATALALAVQQDEPSALIGFVQQYPESRLAPDALLLASEVSNDKTDDSATSTENPAFSCKLSIRRDGNKASVTWAIAGASSISLHPLGFRKGQAIPTKGEQTVDFDNYIRVSLVAKDSAGHELKCSVLLNTTKIDDNAAGHLTSVSA